MGMKIAGFFLFVSCTRRRQASRRRYHQLARKKGKKKKSNYNRLSPPYCMRKRARTCSYSRYTILRPPPRANYTHSSLRSAAEANERRAVANAAAAAAHFLRLKRHEYKRVEGSSSLYLKKILVLFILKRKRKKKTIYHCSSPISSVNELFSRCKFLLLFYALLEKKRKTKNISRF